MRFLPVDIVNSADVIAENRDFVSINGATAVDLYGQVAADTINDRQYSGHRWPRGLPGRRGPAER